MRLRSISYLRFCRFSAVISPGRVVVGSLFPLTSPYSTSLLSDSNVRFW